ncbi:MAG: hypothetical protein ACYS7Y_34575 [Planctomycetota bacterium]|jgi:uncharacterized membrane protein
MKHEETAWWDRKIDRLARAIEDKRIPQTRFEINTFWISFWLFIIAMNGCDIVRTTGKILERM